MVVSGSSPLPLLAIQVAIAFGLSVIHLLASFVFRRCFFSHFSDLGLITVLFYPTERLPNIFSYVIY